MNQRSHKRRHYQRIYELHQYPKRVGNQVFITNERQFIRAFGAPRLEDNILPPGFLEGVAQMDDKIWVIRVKETDHSSIVPIDPISTNPLVMVTSPYTNRSCAHCKGRCVCPGPTGCRDPIQDRTQT